MNIRAMQPQEEPAVLHMMRLMWLDCDDEKIVDDHVLVVDRHSAPLRGAPRSGTAGPCDRGDGRLGGFLALSLRPWAEGCTSTPCTYIEGWWIDADLRRGGLGAALVRAAEAWALAQGSAELGSDAEIDNSISITAHRALGSKKSSATCSSASACAEPEGIVPA